MGGKAANKAGYFDKLKGLLEEYQSIFIVGVDNVSSQQMHEIRHALRGEGVVLMGKNTMVRIEFWRSLCRIVLIITGSSCCKGFRRRLPGVRASPSICQGQRRVCLHQW